MSEWQNLYNPQNLNLIYCLDQCVNADIIIEVHEKRPVNLLIDKPIILPDQYSDKQNSWNHPNNKKKYHSLFKEIEKIRFGQIILKIRSFKIIEMKSYFKVRLQKKKCC